MWQICELIENPSQPDTMYVLAGIDGHLFLLGTQEEVAALLTPLAAFVTAGRVGEPVESAELYATRIPRVGIAEAVEMALEYDPERFGDAVRTRNRITQAGSRGSLLFLIDPETGERLYDRRRLLGWIMR